MRRCHECNFLIGPESDECPRCGARISRLEATMRWIRIFVVALFFIAIGVFGPVAFFVWLAVDRAGYIMEWWMFLLTGAIAVALISAIVTMRRSRVRAEAKDARLSMEMPAVRPDFDSMSDVSDKGDRK